MLNRDDITDWLLLNMEDMGVPVGDNERPPDGGWSQGEPNTGEFRPYVVLNTGQATTQQGRLCPDFWDYRMIFSVTCWAVSRRGVDQLSYRMVESLTHLPRTEFGKYRVDIVRIETIGAIGHDFNQTPHLWSCNNTLSVDAVRCEK